MSKSKHRVSTKYVPSPPSTPCDHIRWVPKLQPSLGAAVMKAIDTSLHGLKTLHASFPLTKPSTSQSAFHGPETECCRNVAVPVLSIIRHDYIDFWHVKLHRGKPLGNGTKKKPKHLWKGGKKVGQRNFIPELPPSQERDKTPNYYKTPELFSMRKCFYKPFSSIPL